MEQLAHLSPPLPTDPEHRTAAPSAPLPPSLAELRASIDQVDQELLAALARRAELARAVARMKRVGGIPPVDPAREAVIVRTAVGRARELRIPDEEVRDLAWRTLALCRSAQGGGRGGTLP
jgi:chorismate mutase